MKFAATLLLSLVAGTALAHGNHDDAEPIVPLKPGARVQSSPAPTPTADSKTEAKKLTKAKADKKRTDTPEQPVAETPAAAKP